jgi:DNA-binding GntR family transcriptional regulator
MDQRSAATPEPALQRSRDSTGAVHRALREAILRGELAAGTWLSQVQIAKQYAVSRGPVREALRLLQREGLVEAEVNQRARIAEFSVEDLEQLYAARIITEALALTLSVPRFSEEDLERLAVDLEQLDRLAGSDIEAWELVHRRFHLALVGHAGERLERMIEQNIDHSERYRRVYIAQSPRAWSVGAAEHHDIVNACAARDAARAAALLATHLSRTALTVFMLAAPEHDPAAIRAALAQATGRTPSEAPQRRLGSTADLPRRRREPASLGGTDDGAETP